MSDEFGDQTVVSIAKASIKLVATCPTCSVYHGAVPTFYECDEHLEWTTSKAPKMKGAGDSFLQTASMRNGQHYPTWSTLLI